MFVQAAMECLFFRSPSLVVLEDLHCLGASGEGTADRGERQASSSLAASLDALHTAPPPRHVVVIATTNHIEAVHSSLRRPGRFDREIEVTAPSAAERKQVLFFEKKVCDSIDIDFSRCWRCC